MCTEAFLIAKINKQHKNDSKIYRNKVKNKRIEWQIMNRGITSVSGSCGKLNKIFPSNKARQ